MPPNQFGYIEWTIVNVTHKFSNTQGEVIREHLDMRINTMRDPRMVLAALILFTVGWAHAKGKCTSMIYK